MKSYIKAIVIILLCLIIIISILSSTSFCNFVSFDISTILSFVTSKTGLYILLPLSIIVFISYQYLKNTKTQENFEVMLGDNMNNDVKRINLKDLFAFVELFQINDLDPDNSYGNLVCLNRDDMIIIRNTVTNLLRNIHHIVYVNDKDNFYHRFIVAKVGSNVYQDHIRPQRRRNYDEMVRDNIGKQFTFMPETALDKYYPRPNLDSKHQEPLPTSMNIHNYYTYANTEINLLALKMIIELVQGGNHDDFGLLVRPTEHMTFEEEFMVPVKSIINDILTIVNSNTFREYMTTQMRV